MSVAETNSAAATTENMTNNNDNTNEEHETMEDNINEAASEDSGMSSVDNNNVNGIINIFRKILMIMLDGKEIFFNFNVNFYCFQFLYCQASTIIIIQDF